MQCIRSTYLINRKSHVVQIMMDRQDRGNWHLNSSFQVTCDWQLSQLFRCLSLCLIVFLSINSLLVKKKLQQIILPPKYNFSPRLTSLRKMCENLDPITFIKMWLGALPPRQGNSHWERNLDPQLTSPKIVTCKTWRKKSKAVLALLLKVKIPVYKKICFTPW